MLHWVRDTILTSNLASSPNWIIIWFIVNVARIYFLPVWNHIYKACEVHHGAGDQHWHVNVRQRDKRACIACFSLAWESRMHNELPASRKLHSHYIFFLHLFQFRKQYTFEFVELMMMMSMSSLHNSLINASYLFVVWFRQNLCIGLLHTENAHQWPSFQSYTYQNTHVFRYLHLASANFINIFVLIFVRSFGRLLN